MLVATCALAYYAGAQQDEIAVIITHDEIGALTPYVHLEGRWRMRRADFYLACLSRAKVHKLPEVDKQTCGDVAGLVEVEVCAADAEIPTRAYCDRSVGLNLHRETLRWLIDQVGNGWRSRPIGAHTPDVQAEAAAGGGG